MRSDEKSEMDDGLAIRMNAPLLNPRRVDLHFPDETGGDLTLEPGDVVTIVVYDKRKLQRVRRGGKTRSS